jgi:hypothetical protein
MALIYNRRVELSEEDLMGMVKKALRDDSSTPGESAYTNMLLERGEAVLAEPDKTVGETNAGAVVDAIAHDDVPAPVSPTVTRRRRKRHSKELPVLIKDTADTLKGRSWQ